MADDPHPEFRCRCVNRTVWIPELAHLLSPADPYVDRCPSRPTQEDGLCDHCRQTVSCSDLECVDMDGSRGWGCCLQPYADRAFTDQMTPCLAPRPITEEAPF